MKIHMQLSTTKGETKIADLTKRVFDIKGKGSKDAAKKAGDALLGANPHLQDLSNVAPGTPIVIPEVATVKTDAVVSPLQTGTTLLASQLHGALSAAQSNFESSLAQETARVNSITDALKSDTVKKAAAKDTDLKDAISNIADAQKARLKELDQLKAAQSQAIDQMGKELDALLSRFAPIAGKP